jgi:hypothetical protein
MKRKRLALLLVVAVGGFGLLAWWSYTAPGINKRIADQIVPGMSLQTVEELIGKPCGDYTTPLLDRDPDELPLSGSPIVLQCHSWESDAGLIQVLTDNKDRVVQITFTAYGDPLLNKIRRVLGLHQPSARVWTR